MKRISILTLILTAFFLSSNTSCNPESIEPVAYADQVSEDETNGLIYMREEEKLARDVYITLFKMYDNTIFNNISKAEQRHMDQVLTILEKYNIKDPSLPTVGEFSIKFLQDLFDDLITQGSDSEIAALIVGATIEDVDIYDLDNFTAETTDADIIKLYSSLACGSRNHMRAFISRLTDLGVTYSPQFISQEKFDSIVSGEQEKCGQLGN